MSVANQVWDYTTPVVTSEGIVKVGSYASRISSGTNSSRDNRGNLVYQENDYTCTRVLKRDRVIGWKFPYMGSYPYTGSVLTAQPQARSDWTSNDELALWGKLCDKIRGHEFNLAVFIGEGRQSLQMISQSSSTIQSAMLHVANKDYRRARRTLGLKSSKVGKITGEFSKDWLAFQLGWAPLVADFTSAAIAVHALTNRPLEVEYSASSYKPQKWGYGSCDGVAKHAYTRCKLRAIFSAPIPPWQTLGLYAPEVTTWETLPATWVLDYMAPVGDYLATVGLLSRISPAKGYYMGKLEVARCLGLKPYPGGSRTYLTDDGAFFKVVYYTRKRVLQSSVPLPTFRPLGEMLDWKRATNVVAYAVVTKSKIEKLTKRV